MKANRIFQLLLVVFCSTILFFSLKGISGNPEAPELNSEKWRTQGPFDTSPERGRFALTYSLAEDKSVFFSISLARFTLPDLGYRNGKFVSLFAPGVSFIVLPGFLIGKLLGSEQVGAFSIITIIAGINALLIYAISRKLGISKLSGTIASILFLFGSPSFAYAVTLYQHHLSLLLILFSFYLLMGETNFIKLFIVWGLISLSLPIDYPNFFMMIPIFILAILELVKKLYDNKLLNLQKTLLYSVTFLSSIIPLCFFLWFNNVSYGNPFQLSGTITGVHALDENNKPTAIRKDNQILEEIYNPEKTANALNFFNTRNIVNGLYIHLASPDRGMLYYSPILLLGLCGIGYLTIRNPKSVSILLGIILSNIILYSMWGDPWGGWAFGSRYLIPTYAILSIFLGATIDLWQKKAIFLFFFLIIAGYSIFINTAGALTSNANPPQIQVLELEKISGMVQKYTYERNLDFLIAGNSKSFVFHSFANIYLSAWNYFLIIFGSIFSVIFVLTFLLYFKNKS